MQLNDQQKKQLSALAEKALKAAVESRGFALPDCPDENFKQKSGVFITLMKNNRVRGCIGQIEPILSLWRAVAENTQSAAIKDYRFPPVKPEELNNITIEISVLTEPKKVKYDQIKPGEGVIIKNKQNQATYLPEVWKSFENKKQFFASLCQKAGLEFNCFKNKSTEFFTYKTIKFSEQKL